MPTLYNCPTKKQSGEKDMVGPACLCGLEIIFILLAKAIAIHVQITIIEVGKLGFEGLFARIRPMILFQQLDGGGVSLQEVLVQLFSET